MENKKRLIDANALLESIEGTDWYTIRVDGSATQGAPSEEVAWYKATDIYAAVENAPTVDAVEVEKIEEVKREILQTLDTLIATHRDISNSQFSNYEKFLDIPKSSNDYYGIKAEAYKTARRLVNAALIDLCPNCGADMRGDGNG